MEVGIESCRKGYLGMWAYSGNKARMAHAVSLNVSLKTSDQPTCQRDSSVCSTRGMGNPGDIDAFGQNESARILEPLDEGTHYPSSVKQYLCGFPVAYTIPFPTNVFILFHAV